MVSVLLIVESVLYIDVCKWSIVGLLVGLLVGMLGIDIVLRKNMCWKSNRKTKKWTDLWRIQDMIWHYPSPVSYLLLHSCLYPPLDSLSSNSPFLPLSSTLSLSLSLLLYLSVQYVNIVWPCFKNT